MDDMNEDEVITFEVDPSANTHNTSLKIEGVKVPYQKMLELFGEPSRLKNHDRCRVYWNISFSDGAVLSAYDWNENRPVEEVDEWNISSHDFMTAYRFHDIIAGRPIEV